QRGSACIQSIANLHPWVRAALGACSALSQSACCWQVARTTRRPTRFSRWRRRDSSKQPARPAPTTARQPSLIDNHPRPDTNPRQPMFTPRRPQLDQPTPIPGAGSHWACGLVGALLLGMVVCLPAGAAPPATPLGQAATQVAAADDKTAP